jgi:acyl carrier protein
MTNLEKLRGAFAEGLGQDATQITDVLKYGDPGWDSVAHMVLIAAIERAFDIMLDTSDVIDMSSFAKAREIVAKYGVAFDVAG